MIGYQFGYTKSTKDLCQILGFWGDITIGPFYTFGLTVKDEKYY